MTQGEVAGTIIRRAKEALSIADHGFEHELEWLVGELSRMSAANNYQFFRRIAARKDAASFLKWCLCIMRGSSDLNWILHEAEKVYGSGVPPVQPGLLRLIQKTRENHNK